jgi:hypothetical protein
MNNIYNEIAQLTDKFKDMCYGLTTDKNDIENAVQELMMYFLTMNKQVLKDIYTKDGKQGIIKYGAVVLKRALTSPRSPFYYKYKKYYTNLQYNTSNSTRENINDFYNNIYNVPETIVNWYDRDVFKLYYYEGNTLDSLAEKTKISRNSLFITIDKVRTKLKEVLDE